MVYTMHGSAEMRKYCGKAGQTVRKVAMKCYWNWEGREGIAFC